ncbi:helix-turn-helix transcriptional regulator [Paenibacillus sp. 2TAB23]|uniref:helix-turn-helix transcriptional regulator n=1 Tax=Paenibacillus sp. 2TAB23 TaxID=3233004 RepID=UPI003F94F3F2
MNKTERLLAIVLELQRSKVQRAEDLAEQFETSVRTIYRDMQALCEAGIPIIGETGIGYSLMDGYFLPPVSFTAEEAVALLIGTEFIEQRFDPGYGATALSVRRKIEAILPLQVQAHSAKLRSNIRLLNRSKSEMLEKEKAALKIIRMAMVEGRKVCFSYRANQAAWDGESMTDRTASPYGLVMVQGNWMMIGSCDWRKDIRHFRVSRMDGLVMSDESFQLPEHFDLNSYSPKDDRHILIRVLFQASLAERVKEADSYYMEDAKWLSEGYEVLFRVRRQEELLHWILGFGSGAEVLEPDEFRRSMRKELDKMIKRY